MQVHDRVPGKRGRLPVGRAATKSRQALHRHAAGVGRLWRDSDDDRKRGVELVAPLDRHRLPALDLDRRTRHRPVVAPDP